MGIGTELLGRPLPVCPSNSFSVFLSLRPTVLPSPRSLPPLGFIVSLLERKDRTWPK